MGLFCPAFSPGNLIVLDGSCGGIGKEKGDALQLNILPFRRVFCNLRASFNSRDSEVYQIQLTTPSHPHLRPLNTEGCALQFGGSSLFLICVTISDTSV